MFLLKCVLCNGRNRRKNRFLTRNLKNNEEQVNSVEQEPLITDKIKFVYLTYTTLQEDIIHALDQLTRSSFQTFTSTNDCVEYISSITDKVFLIIDDLPSTTLLESIEPMKQIDSVFIYSSPSDLIVDVIQQRHSYLIHWCENESAFVDRIKTSCDELDRQTAVFSLYNQKEKLTRDLSNDSGSYIFFNLFRNALENMPKTLESKITMIKICKTYYRNNPIELNNIEDFDRDYSSIDAIAWFLKDTFIYKLINKALRTDDVDALFHFRFYIMDLSEQLQQNFLKLNKEILKLYYAVEVSDEDLVNLQKSIGNLISPNGYLLTSDKHSVAYDFVKTFTKKEGITKVIFEYDIDLNIVKNIIVADVQQYSPFPEQAQFIIDIGSSFQIDNCQFNADEDLWYIRAHATDQATDLAADYIEYQKKKISDSSPLLMYGNLLLEIGDHVKAERYFDTILCTCNPTNEEIDCLFFNFGRVHRLKGDYNRAISCYHRAYNFNMNARRKHLANAGKVLNSLGVVYSEQGKQLQAEECFQRAIKLYKKNISSKHIDVAGALINLGTIAYDRQNYDEAILKYTKAKKIYDRSLPSIHPNRASLRVNLGNVYFMSGDYEKAREEYESALKMQQISLPANHLDIARTLHNHAVVHKHQGNNQQANEYVKRAEEIVNETLPSNHPFIVSLDTTNSLLIE